MSVAVRPANLALLGGSPVRDAARPWPKWPGASPQAERNLLAVLRGDRWTLTGPIGRAPLFERMFARMFAQYTRTRHCVPVDHGSSALVVALEALGLGCGDRVIVPTLTWTASASAALRAGLVPILVDVDPQTGCIGPENVPIDRGARAVIAVHWSCALADVPALVAVARGHGMDVIEDCAQAHGAEWAGRSVGSMGRMGCFSMQQGKVLTSGEGGAVVTDDDAIARVLEELRADSRRYRDDPGRQGESDLIESASVMGSNFCLSEFQAAVLCARLPELEGEHAIRARNYAALTKLVEGIHGVRLARPAAAQTRMSIYELPIVFDTLPAGMNADQVAAALSAELHRPFYRTDAPLHRTPLLRPWTKPAMRPLAERFAAENQGSAFPHADYLYEHVVVTHHSALLGAEQDMADIALAIGKVAGTSRL